MLIVIGFLVFGRSSDDNSGGSNETEKSAVETPAPVVQEDNSYRNAVTDLSLNGIDLGLQVSQLKSRWGEPSEVKPRSDGNVTYVYDTIEIGIVDNKTHSLLTSDQKFKTLRGMHVGSNYRDVVSAYGSSQHTLEVDDLILYEYDFYSLDNQAGLLRFAVRKSDNRVDYISVRIPDAPKPSQGSDSAQQAAAAFVDYHKAITDDNYSRAYNLMTENRKGTMGTLSQFSSGYKSTISSVITSLTPVSTSSDSVVFDYILEARDSASGGRVIYRQFSGRVEMVKTSGSWKIDNVRSNKVSEFYE